MKMNYDENSLSIQQKIYKFIVSNPGVHLRRIKRELNLKLSTLRYHLDSLERQNLLSSEEQANRKVFFAIGKVNSRDKKAIALLQQKRFRDIISTLLIVPNQTHKGLCEKLSLNPSTLTKYLSILLKNKMIAIDYKENTKTYIVQNSHETLLILFTYKQSLWDGLVDRVLRLFFE